METLSLPQIDELPINKYSTIETRSPVLFLGMRVKNRFDELRYCIRDDFEPQYVLHFINSAKIPRTVEAFYLYGIKLSPVKDFYNMCLKMLDIKTFFSDNLYNVFDKYGLDTTNLLVSDGLIQLHKNNVNKLSDFPVSPNMLRNILLHNPNIPLHANFYDINLYILFRTHAYAIDPQYVTKKCTKRQKFKHGT